MKFMQTIGRAFRRPATGGVVPTTREQQLRDLLTAPGVANPYARDPDDTSWIQTYTGKRFYVFDPRPEDVCIEDIAHALSMQCRFQGHCRFFYSTAQHSVLLAIWVLQHTGQHSLALAALLHDSDETYLADLATPTKRRLPEYRAIGQKLLEVILPKFGVTMEQVAQIKQYDTRILTDERKALFLDPIPWGTDAKMLYVQIGEWGPARAEEEFMNWYVYLKRNVDAQR